MHHVEPRAVQRHVLEGLAAEPDASPETQRANRFLGSLEDRGRDVDADAFVPLARDPDGVITDSAPGVEKPRAGRRLYAVDDAVHDEVVEPVE